MNTIWIYDASGPPPDSIHKTDLFVCGVEGTIDEHLMRKQTTYGVCGFIGYWHTHPRHSANQSTTDITSMAKLIGQIGENRRRSIMMIFGQHGDRSVIRVFIYESASILETSELLCIADTQLELEIPFI